jgi:hypothetical protein
MTAVDYNSAFGSIRKELIPIVEKALETGEQVVWIGQPLPNSVEQKYLLKLTWGLIAPTSFVLLWLVLTAHPATDTDAYQMNQIKTMVFGLVGILFVIGLFVHAWLHFKTMNTVYVLTNNRALILDPQRKYEFKRLPQLDITNRSDGTTDIVFEKVKLAKRLGTYTKPRGFINVKDAEKIEHLLISKFEPSQIRHDPRRETDTW